MASYKPVDDLEGLDDYDRMLVADMDDNRPSYQDAKAPADAQGDGAGQAPRESAA